ncbi:hypothetical protein [Candidatus Lokiarchaeum ossiferum]|uniref:hypothetical protein n=1 Tax=Candidatus Lokiarchaeum ossiferum TaxID=2951803 RepID=UPI00352E2BD8
MELSQGESFPRNLEKISKTKNIPQNAKKIRAVALVSGGLDSAIAVKLIIDQGIDVYAMTFHSPFCTCSSGGCSAAIFAEKLEIPIKHVSKDDDYLRLVKNPKFTYGKNINPCIDCRIHILERAKEYMNEIGAQFIITGEVLGQRPKSQMIRALKTIENEAGLAGRILRPLSAKLLDPTIMENEGIIDRSLLLDIQGRRRNIQVELGRNFNLIEQYCAGGGCRLTDKNFASRLKDYFNFTENPKMADMKFLRIGRHFRYQNLKFIVGKNENENFKLKTWVTNQDVLIEAKDISSPITLVFNPKKQEDLILPAQITLRYSDTEENSNYMEVFSNNLDFKNFLLEKNPNIEEIIKEYRI